MKREIKFRAILKNEYSFRDVWGINFARKEVMVLIAGCYEWIEWKELVQFTGLKDKNGKEIWEGDIVQWLTDADEGLRSVKEIVEYFAGAFQVVASMPPEEFEIIGNIYENPELL